MVEFLSSGQKNCKRYRIILAMVLECRNMPLLTAVQNAIENGEFEKLIRNYKCDCTVTQV